VRQIVKCTNLARILRGILTLTLLCAVAKADAGGRAPQFTAQTIDGEVLTNASLAGKVVLLQFWATWCPYCRRDQSAVDSIERAYAGRGLVVLAVDVGESEEVVRAYLGRNPRSCRVALNDGLASRFGARGFPYYVVINREGDIAGTQSGSGGEGSLLHLLSRAGLSKHSDTRETASSPGSGGAKVIEGLRAEASLSPKPNPTTILVFTNGERLEVDHYTIDSVVLHVAVGGQQRSVPLSALDIKTTIAVNHQRGIDLKLPQSRSELTIAF
jgi:thiol-disulfide isomerase/thioredoxin